MTEAPIVQTAAGKVRGRWREQSAAFLGIPFAQAPVGDLRFSAPVPPAPWEGVRDALAYGATAQRGDKGITLIPEPSIPGDATLNVNVFTPAPGASDAKLPVLVWIHGGGYVAGSPASDWYDGHAFNRDGIVTVSLSYRLGFDGFGHIAGAPSNRGVRDWLAALEWVHDNIAEFGGDPAHVTIAGQSAGGGAVLTILGMPKAQHLFHAVWALSPVLADVPVERSRTLAAKIAHLAGVAPTLEGFRSVPEAEIERLQDAAAQGPKGDPVGMLQSLIDEGLPWGPSIDGDLLTRPTLAALSAGVGADKPLVIGTTDDEFTMVLDGVKGRLRVLPAGLLLGRILRDPTTRRTYLGANGPQRRKGTAAVLGRFVTDAIFRTGVVRIADARGDAPTFVYRFAWPSPTRTWALHCLDVPFWFDHLDADGVTAVAGDSPPRQLAAALHGAAASFIRDGDPDWPAWARHPGVTRIFGGPSSAPDVAADGYASVRALLT